MSANVHDVINVLENSERLGGDKDEPEGNRYIRLSDTLALQMSNSLKKIPQKDDAIDIRKFCRALFRLQSPAIKRGAE